MKRAFQNKRGSTLGKIPLFIYIDIPNKIASHRCFVTDTALPGICNNQILVRQLSKLCFVSFFSKGQQLLVLLFHRPGSASLLWHALPSRLLAAAGPARPDHR